MGRGNSEKKDHPRVKVKKINEKKKKKIGSDGKGTSGKEYHWAVDLDSALKFCHVLSFHQILINFVHL